MAKVSIATLERAASLTEPGVIPGVESLALLHKPKDPIHLFIHRLDAGASYSFVHQPADVALFVWHGSVEAGGAVLCEGSSAVVEHGAMLRVTAMDEGAELVAFNLGMPADHLGGGHVHLLPVERVPSTLAFGWNEGVGGSLHADAQCPTCRVWLHENSYAMADRETTVHSHSEDEVIFVRSGSIRLGNRLYGPGTAVAVTANTKYGFFSGPDGLGFVNFRAASPTYTSADGNVVLDEAELWGGRLGKPPYLAPI